MNKPNEDDYDSGYDYPGEYIDALVKYIDLLESSSSSGVKEEIIKELKSDISHAKLVGTGTTVLVSMQECEAIIEYLESSSKEQLNDTSITEEEIIAQYHAGIQNILEECIEATNDFTVLIWLKKVQQLIADYIPMKFNQPVSPPKQD